VRKRWGWLLAFVAVATVACPSDTPARAQSAEVAYALDHAADTYGVSRGCLWNIARRETGGTFRPWVTNSRSGAAGLMQYLATTWATLAPRAGYGRSECRACAPSAGWASWSPTRRRGRPPGGTAAASGRTSRCGAGRAVS
jgi:hypothetical protein